MNEELFPEGWASVSLIEVATLQRGFDLPVQDRKDGKIPIIASNGQVGVHNEAKVKGPGVVTGRSGTIGKVHYVKEDFWPLNTALFVTDFHGNDPQFISLLLWTLRLEQFHAGTGVPTLNRNDIHVVPVTVPPLAEQTRIVAKVAPLLTDVNAARQRLAKMPVILKRFRQAVLAAACSGRLTEDWREKNGAVGSADQTIDSELAGSNRRIPDVSILPEIPQTWAWLFLPDSGEMNRGRSRNRPRDASHLYGGPYPFIQTGDIANSGGRIVKHRQTYSAAGLAQSRLWQTGTICITIAANIADSAILTYPACFPDSVVGIVTNPRLCSTEYLEFFLRTARENLAAFAPATAQANINIAILNEVAVPIPPLPEQHEIVRRVEALFKQADQIEATLSAATARVEKLTQAILAKAFRGELVPIEAELARREGRDYEPASVLLERIRAQKQPATTKSRKRRGR